MPDSDTSAEATSRTAEEWEVEYKKLQRKLSRNTTRTSDLTTQVAELRAGNARIEQIVERLIDSDDDAAFRQTLKQQRESDTSAARVTAEVESLLDDKDVDFMTDPRLSEARRIYEEINRTGNMGLVDSLKQSISGISDEPSETNDATVEEQIATAVATDRRERARVDGGSTTAPNPQSVSRSDLSNMNPSQMSIAEMKERTKQALEQQLG